MRALLNRNPRRIPQRRRTHEGRDGKPKQRQADKHKKNERAARENEVTYVKAAKRGERARLAQRHAAGRQYVKTVCAHVPKYFV